MERTEEFAKADWGLPPLAVEEWLGFIFVNFDVNAEPLAPTLGRYTPYLENYHLANAVCPGTFTLESMPWNWKVMFENFNDGYHANRLHEYVQDFVRRIFRHFPSRGPTMQTWCSALPVHPSRRKLQRHPPSSWTSSQI